MTNSTGQQTGAGKADTCKLYADKHKSVKYIYQKIVAQPYIQLITLLTFFYILLKVFNKHQY